MLLHGIQLARKKNRLEFKQFLSQFHACYHDTQNIHTNDKSNSFSPPQTNQHFICALYTGNIFHCSSKFSTNQTIKIISLCLVIVV